VILAADGCFAEALEHQAGFAPYAVGSLSSENDGHRRSGKVFLGRRCFYTPPRKLNECVGEMGVRKKKPWVAAKKTRSL
jgi:hypothetical protein